MQSNMQRLWNIFALGLVLFLLARLSQTLLTTTVRDGEAEALIRSTARHELWDDCSSFRRIKGSWARGWRSVVCHGETCARCRVTDRELVSVDGESDSCGISGVCVSPSSELERRSQIPGKKVAGHGEVLRFSNVPTHWKRMDCVHGSLKGNSIPVNVENGKYCILPDGQGFNVLSPAAEIERSESPAERAADELGSHEGTYSSQPARQVVKPCNPERGRLVMKASGATKTLGLKRLKKGDPHITAGLVSNNRRVASATASASLPPRQH
ncbi:hypothetical protein CYME_CMN009C [Cyanidioschyzon merolae strain 10D]|uniref:Uncharacterized protein n=1 Tax=Cyanidioschyzon merolae (strain NIES-3377 / 10D) TaxID=280699 RepID=M1VE46_CYAM1|nr:hypothetical protein CYME_CMN009C [Cyanidioschyzon merolae strain 10D]BAM81157.1 hypothetical protein CYME_CMN009C [Cyanidioschyzon merolae strain 10D]|eukprot:XP_005537193.1 hypothetical protein CYME_CMN009C [Cyanidioschyzon merolae strain 10D]